MHASDPAAVIRGSTALTDAPAGSGAAAHRAAGADRLKRLVVSPDLVEEMHAHARSAYPEECCGFLYASADATERDGTRRVIGLRRAPNRAPGRRSGRFAISSEDLFRADGAATRTGRVVCGFYHSHPDRPARPSRADQEHAWPWYAYVILESGGSSRRIGAFQLDPPRCELRRVRWSVDPAGGSTAIPPSVKDCGHGGIGRW